MNENSPARRVSSTKRRTNSVEGGSSVHAPLHLPTLRTGRYLKPLPETGESAMSLRALVTACYQHVAPDDIGMHYERLEKLPQPEQALPTPQLLNQNRRGIAFADVFCGAGGLSLGFELEGAVCRFALDHDSSAIETFAINRPKNLKVVCSGIEEMLAAQNLDCQVPLVIGGPPCQGFSLANQQPRAADPRNRLYSKFLEAASRFRAGVVVIENVPGILKQWAMIRVDLERHGYSSRVFELEASDFGAPQRRRRVFIVAVRGLGLFRAESFLEKVATGVACQRTEWTPSVLQDALFGLQPLVAKTVSNSTHLETKEFGYTIGAQIDGSTQYLDRINEGFPKGFLFNHRTKYNNKRDINLFHCLREGEDTTSEAFARINPYKNRDHIFKDKFYRLHTKRSSKTITAHMYYDCHMYIHPTQDRGLTPREAARIQGFPDQYVFLGKPNEWYRQIGNSVSPIVARCLAKAILSAMELHF